MELVLTLEGVDRSFVLMLEWMLSGVIGQQREGRHESAQGEQLSTLREQHPEAPNWMREDQKE